MVYPSRVADSGYHRGMGRGRRVVDWKKALVVLTEHPSACYFRDRWGVWWRIYDHGKQCPPAEGSPVRYFVGQDRRRYRYTFADGETRQLSPKALVEQRDRAEFVIRGGGAVRG